MMKRRRGKNRWQILIMLAICVIAGMLSASVDEYSQDIPFTLDQIAPYGGNSYAVVNGNIPYFEDSMTEMEPFEECQLPRL